MRERLEHVLASAHPDGWPVLPPDMRIDRLLKPDDEGVISAIVKAGGGTVRRSDDGRSLEIVLRPHAAFADEHLAAGEKVRITYFLKPRIWRSTVATWMARGLPGLLRHIARLRAPAGDRDYSLKLYAALGVAAAGLLSEAARKGHFESVAD